MASSGQVELNVGDGGVAVVLLSGGIDSAALLALAKTRGLEVQALHVNYGQAAAEAEAAAASRLAAAFGVTLRHSSYEGSHFGAGEIRGRNAFLLMVALLEFPADAGLVLIGVHGGTHYVDCSSDFIASVLALFDLHTKGTIGVEAPFVDLLKGDVVRLARDLGVPLDLTHSCESSNASCGSCQSCRDRKRLLAELTHARA